MRRVSRLRLGSEFALAPYFRLTALILGLLLAGTSTGDDDLSQPDVLVIVIDDLNDWIEILDQSSPIKTPNLKRLAERGTLFSKAYCSSPACKPSRASAWTGLRPTTTGVYGNKSDWKSATRNHPTLMQRFKEAGYQVHGAGKIFHHHLNGAFHDKGSFHLFQPMSRQKYPGRKLNNAQEYGSRNTDWGAFPKQESETIDYQTVSYCIEQLRSRDTTKPLFLACGIYKPHSPFFAPAKYHEPYTNIPLPSRDASDWTDLPTGAKALLKNKKWFWDGMMKVEKRSPGSYRDFIRSYAACASFADAQVGRLLDALDKSPRRKETIVVLWSDHGFHLGEKNHIEKFALWEKTNHIPLIVVSPGKTKPNTVCARPVDMTSLYPTLLDLCQLPNKAKVDGTSLVPLLQSPRAEWKRPAIMTYLQGNHAIRSDRFRYIRYVDGTEELYDHEMDPAERVNLARNSKFKEVIASHKRWLPTNEAKQVPDLRR